jgi:hypothetical protein
LEAATPTTLLDRHLVFSLQELAGEVREGNAARVMTLRAKIEPSVPWISSPEPAKGCVKLSWL